MLSTGLRCRHELDLVSHTDPAGFDSLVRNPHLTSMIVFTGQNCRTIRDKHSPLWRRRSCDSPVFVELEILSWAQFSAFAVPGADQLLSTTTDVVEVSHKTAIVKPDASHFGCRHNCRIRR